MANRKGVKHYPESFKTQVKQEYEAGASMMSLHRKYGVSVYSIESSLKKESRRFNESSETS